MAQYRNVKEFTDKIQKVYAKYREEYIEASNNIAEEEKLWTAECRRGWRNPDEKQNTTLKHQAKEKALREAFESIEDRARAEFDEIKAECMEIFKPYGGASASMLDMPTLELLKSGILKDDELIKLADDFTDNVTMLRLIGKYAGERADVAKDFKMKDFALKCQRASFPYLEPIDGLAYWSLKAIRADKDNRNKDNTIAKSNGIAKEYEKQAEKFTADAEKFYIEVSEQ